MRELFRSRSMEQEREERGGSQEKERKVVEVLVYARSEKNGFVSSCFGNKASNPTFTHQLSLPSLPHLTLFIQQKTFDLSLSLSSPVRSPILSSPSVAPPPRRNQGSVKKKDGVGVGGWVEKDSGGIVLFVFDPEEQESLEELETWLPIVRNLLPSYDTSYKSLISYSDKKDQEEVPEEEDWEEKEDGRERGHEDEGEGGVEGWRERNKAIVLKERYSLSSFFEINLIKKRRKCRSAFLDIIQAYLCPSTPSPSPSLLSPPLSSTGSFSYTSPPSSPAPLASSLSFSSTTSHPSSLSFSSPTPSTSPSPSSQPTLSINRL